MLVFCNINKFIPFGISCSRNPLVVSDSDLSLPSGNLARRELVQCMVIAEAACELFELQLEKK
jgi:hypothetical protein